ncbi:MAG TPA: nuclear transport factor 2 family protein [Burkholderiaceae bacterium]|nr:nuclear transport factor 2 family protein [Burkholderiaceae bacterium]
MSRCLLLLCVSSSLLSACAIGPRQTDAGELKAQVTAAEVAFAKTMADRDHAAFSSFISEEAVFINGGKPVRGKAAVAADWKKFYDAPRAPFSWKPDLVEVLPSGTLAYSMGPVTNPDGVVFARFHSTWRLEAPGVWRVVFDNGTDVCNCPKQ